MKAQTGLACSGEHINIYAAQFSTIVLKDARKCDVCGSAKLLRGPTGIPLGPSGLNWAIVMYHSDKKGVVGSTLVIVGQSDDCVSGPN